MNGSQIISWGSKYEVNGEGIQQVTLTKEELADIVKIPSSCDREPEEWQAIIREELELIKSSNL